MVAERERFSTAPIFRLISDAAPTNSPKLADLLRDLDLAVDLDRTDGRILFAASREPNVITIGLQCTCRLQAHAHVSAIMAVAAGLPPQSSERTRIHLLASRLLNWTVGRDLQQWLLRMEGYERPLDGIINGSGRELPEEVLAQLDDRQRTFGEGLFRLASAFVLLHEIGHITLGHIRCEGVESIHQEKAADQFAASWLLGDPSLSAARRLNCLLGVATALLWLTVANVYFGPDEGRTHPNAYDRLFQVLNQNSVGVAQSEERLLWDFVARMLFIHMEHAGFHFDAERMQGDAKDEVNYLIDLLSKREAS